MSAKKSVVIKEPGCKPRHVNISTSLENLQKTVGGYIETLTIATDMCFICNEEGRLQGLPYNFTSCGNPFVGTVILIGVAGDDFADLPLTFAEVKKAFPEMFTDQTASGYNSPFVVIDEMAQHPARNVPEVPDSSEIPNS